MSIKIGDTLPAGSLAEFIEVESEACSLGPNVFEVSALTAGKTIAIFGLPGAYTPTCSAQHVPGYIAHADALKAKGVDEIWCISVNDAFVMGAWGKAQNAEHILMLADGNADLTRALGLVLDGTGFGMGTRSKRFAMIVNNGVVELLNVDAAALEKTTAEAILAAL